MKDAERIENMATSADQMRTTIPCHYKDGEFAGTLHYREGSWEWEAAPDAAPAQPHYIPDDVGFVYFVGASDGAIKIGWALDPGTRLQSLQCGSPVTLSILAIAGGGRRQELEYHRQFKEHRIRGEWFARAPEILAEIEALAQ